MAVCGALKAPRRDAKLLTLNRCKECIGTVYETNITLQPGDPKITLASFQGHTVIERVLGQRPMFHMPSVNVLNVYDVFGITFATCMYFILWSL